MGRNFIERRVIAAGIALCKRRSEIGGGPLTAEDLKAMKVKTISPYLQGTYYVVGLAFIIFGIWVNAETGSMAMSFLPLLVGVGNWVFAFYGNPKSVGSMRDIDLMDLTAEITKRFVAEMDARPGVQPRGPGEGNS